MGERNRNLAEIHIQLYLVSDNNPKLTRATMVGAKHSVTLSYIFLP